VFDVVFGDAFLSKDLCIPVREPRLCSKDTDVEVVDDRTALLLQRRAQHALELFRCLLRFVRSRIVLDRFHVSPPYRRRLILSVSRERGHILAATSPAPRGWSELSQANGLSHPTQLPQ